MPNLFLHRYVRQAHNNSTPQTPTKPSATPKLLSRWRKGAEPITPTSPDEDASPPKRTQSFDPFKGSSRKLNLPRRRLFFGIPTKAQAARNPHSQAGTTPQSLRCPTNQADTSHSDTVGITSQSRQSPSIRAHTSTSSQLSAPDSIHSWDEEVINSVGAITQLMDSPSIHTNIPSLAPLQLLTSSLTSSSVAPEHLPIPEAVDPVITSVGADTNPVEALPLPYILTLTPGMHTVIRLGGNEYQVRLLRYLGATLRNASVHRAWTVSSHLIPGSEVVVFIGHQECLVQVVQVLERPSRLSNMTYDLDSEVNHHHLAWMQGMSAVVTVCGIKYVVQKVSTDHTGRIDFSTAVMAVIDAGVLTPPPSQTHAMLIIGGNEHLVWISHVLGQGERSWTGHLPPISSPRPSLSLSRLRTLPVQVTGVGNQEGILRFYELRNNTFRQLVSKKPLGGTIGKMEVITDDLHHLVYRFLPGYDGTQDYHSRELFECITWSNEEMMFRPLHAVLDASTPETSGDVVLRMGVFDVIEELESNALNFRLVSPLDQWPTLAQLAEDARALSSTSPKSGLSCKGYNIPSEASYHLENSRFMLEFQETSQNELLLTLGADGIMVFSSVSNPLGVVHFPQTLRRVYGRQSSNGTWIFRTLPTLDEYSKVDDSFMFWFGRGQPEYAYAFQPVDGLHRDGLTSGLPFWLQVHQNHITFVPVRRDTSQQNAVISPPSQPYSSKEAAYPHSLGEGLTFGMFDGLSFPDGVPYYLHAWDGDLVFSLVCEQIPIELDWDFAVKVHGYRNPWGEWLFRSLFAEEKDRIDRLHISDLAPYLFWFCTDNNTGYHFRPLTSSQRRLSVNGRPFLLRRNRRNEIIFVPDEEEIGIAL